MGIGMGTDADACDVDVDIEGASDAEVAIGGASS